MIPRNILLFGSEQYIPSRRELRAGPLSAVLQDGVIRYVKLGEIEVLRRFYMALRDQNWNTIPTEFSNWEFEIRNDSFRISFAAENKRGEIDFAWNGSITGESSGKLSYSMSGKARSKFKKRIIGLCALFPIKECAGQRANVVKRNGELVDTNFPLLISHDQPLPGFEDVGKIDFQTHNGLSVSTKFDGDAFEMEDQRSFTDASFKVYSTWNRDSLEGDDVRAGDEVTQSITVSVPESVGSIGNNDDQSKGTLIELDSSDSKPFPKIGLGVSSMTQSLTVREVGLLRRIGISHLRGDLDLTLQDWDIRLGQICAQAQQMKTGLELAIFVDSDRGRQIETLKNELERLGAQIVSVLVFDKGKLATEPGSVALTKELFRDYPTDPEVGGGTDRNFFDLSYVRPSLGPQDLVSYAANPQVHAFDVSSLAETLEGQSWTVKSAHELYQGNPIVVSPITLRPRFNPDAVVPETPETGELPAQVDARQISLFGACWTAGSVKSLAESDVDSVTYYETVGWRGVMERDEGSPLPNKFHSKPRMIFPIYHVLSDLCEMSEGNVRRATSSRPLLVNAISITKDQRTRVLVYNLTWELQDVTLRGIRGDLVSIKRLNEETVEEAMFNVLEYREKVGVAAQVGTSGDLDLKLMPYEIVRIDY